MPLFALVWIWFDMDIDAYYFKYIFEILFLLSNAITVVLTYPANICKYSIQVPCTVTAKGSLRI